MPWDLCTNPAATAAAAAPVPPSLQPPTLPSMSLPLSGKMASALPSLPLHGAHPPRLTGAGLPRRSQTAAILLTGRERSPRPPSPQSPFCNRLNGSGVWARPQTAAGAGQGGCEEGSRAAEEGRWQRGLAPGRSAARAGGAGAPSRPVVGPSAGRSQGV